MRVKYETAYNALDVMHPRHPEFEMLRNQVSVLAKDIAGAKQSLGLPSFPDAAPERVDRIKLRDILYNSFDRARLVNLCHSLKLPYEDFPQDRSGLAHEMVEHSKRNLRTYALIAATYELRRNADWHEL
jgi:hypothetical protein